MLDHEKLDVYQCAIRFVAMAFPLAGRLPREFRPLAEQFRRASLSIPLNIAEAGGKVSIPDRAHFYAIARGSAMECGAIVDVAAVLKLSPEDLVGAKELLERIVSMLTRMCRPAQT